MNSNLLANATDIENWANRLDARSQLPRLVRRLIQATAPDIENLCFPAGEGVQSGGWDGIVTSHTSYSFVPTGTSVWEMGVDKDRKGKADDDYDKRSGDPLGLDTQATSFIFVTPRRWGNYKNKWADARRAEAVWKDVRAYDADDIETWLESAPAVHLWLSMLIGKHPQGAWALEDFWSDWTAKTDPTFSPDLVIGGREQSSELVQSWLRGTPNALMLKGESSEEALAFLSSVITSLDFAEREQFWARAILIEDAASWRNLAISDSNSILIPRFAGEIEGVSRAVSNGHHVFLAGEHGGARKDNALPRLVRDDAEKALEAIGLPYSRAKDLATLARRSFPALRRKLASEPLLHKPAWARNETARELLGPLLLGAWHESNSADREILARMAGTSYEQVQEVLVRWSKVSDPPLRLVGGIWMIAAPEDAWRLLAPFLTGDDLARFKAIAVEVLGAILQRRSGLILEITGNLADAPPPSCSATLREGIASNLALMVALSSSVDFVAETSGEDTARSVVWSIFEKAKGQIELWAALAPILPLLAEAAPTQFLDAVDEGLETDAPLLKAMFEVSDPYGLGSFSPHTYLLWALETLVWNEQFFGRAVLQLARLVRLDPGGRHGNHPSGSLREIFVIWYPNTTLSLARRFKVLDVIRKREPKVAWQLMLAILPTTHGGATCHHPHGPKWHDWKPDAPREMTWEEIFEGASGVVERLLSDVGVDAARWCDLLARTGGLFAPDQIKVLAKLEDVDVEMFSSQTRLDIGGVIREEVLRHREYPDAEWAMQSSHLDRLEEFGRRLEPSDPVLRHRWLFERFVPLQEHGHLDWEERQAEVKRIREEALQEIITSQGMEGILRLGSQADDPETVGLILGELASPPINVDVFLAENLANDESWRAAMATGWIRPKAWRGDISWLQERRTNAEDIWHPEQLGEFLLPHPLTLHLLEDLKNLPEEVQRYYWVHTSNVGLFKEDSKNSEKIIKRLLWVDRAADTLQAIDWALRDNPDLVAPDRIMDVLEQAITSPDVAKLSTARHDAAELFDHLLKTDADRSRLAGLEWVYFSLLEHRRAPKVLHDEMGRDPAFFVELLCLAYRATPGETEIREAPASAKEMEDEGEITEIGNDEVEENPEQAQIKAHMAKRAWALLFEWHQTPGVGEDGTLDVQHLKSWVERVRELAREQERSMIAIGQIGHALAHAPRDEDGAWPHRAVRDLIDEIANVHLENGFECQVFNNRGVTSRGLTDGGVQERHLAAQYEQDAAQIADEWPRTASILRHIAQSYQHHAQREDRSAELTQDLWT